MEIQAGRDLDSLQMNLINHSTEEPNHTAVLVDIVGATRAESIHQLSFSRCGSWSLYTQLGTDPCC
jgi:hypothetical protein